MDILMREARRDNLVRPLVIGLIGTIASSAAASWWLDTGPIYIVGAAALFLVLTAAVVRVAGDGHRGTAFGPANAVTTIRAVMVGLVGGLVFAPVAAAAAWYAVTLAIAAAVLDGVDGRLARRTSMMTTFGARFDMETDAALIFVLSLLVWQHDKAGAWVLLCGLMRYLFVAATWVVPWMARPMRSTFRGKTVAVVQFVGLSVALSPLVPAPASAGVAAVTLAALVWSFAVDVAWLARR